MFVSVCGDLLQKASIRNALRLAAVVVKMPHALFFGIVVIIRISSSSAAKMPGASRHTTQVGRAVVF